MIQAVIASVALAPTHDGDAAMLVTLRFPDGACSDVQVDPADVACVFAKAGVEILEDLIGLNWSVIQVREPVFFGSDDVEKATWSNVQTQA